MKNQFVIFFFLMIGILYGCQNHNVKYPEPLSQLHKNIIADILEEQANPDSVNKYLAELKFDGSWPEIDYTKLIKPTAQSITIKKLFPKKYIWL
jgi:hypothetical protein